MNDSIQSIVIRKAKAEDIEKLINLYGQLQLIYMDS